MDVATPLAGSGATSFRNISTMHQAPLPPWSNEEEKEQYVIDPKAFLLDRCLPYMNSAKIFFNWVVCAVYYLPPYVILPSGQKWHRADVEADNALWEGKVGLCIGKGPQAFRDAPEFNLKFDGLNVNLGDWVQWDIREGRLFTIHRILCRRCKDVQVFSTIDDPNLVY